MADEDGVHRIPVRIEADTAAVPERDRTVQHLPLTTEPIIGPGPSAEEEVEVRRPRLARHEITLSDGHTVGVAVCGRGIPLVVVHGFTAEGILYAQTLSRLVAQGYKVIAIDTAGHGGTLGLPTGAGSLRHYAQLVQDVLDHLGVRSSVLAGHSMGGRLVTEVAARQPDRAIAVFLLDAIVGDVWDRRVNLFRLFPPALAAVGVSLVIDTITTVPLFRDPVQARKLMRLVTPTLIGHVRRPWRMVGPAISIIRSRGSGWMLDKLAQEQVPVYAVHGERDVAVPLSTARSAAKRARAELVVVRGATHSWVLKDPETLPAILRMLGEGTLGEAIERAKATRGVGPDASVEEIEAAFYDPDALVLELTPRQRSGTAGGDLHRAPRYRWYQEAIAAE